jgi:putative transposase
MPRFSRISIVNVPHHVTQRGNARQFILATDEEREVYLGLLRKYAGLYALSLLGYCLMSNHVHLIVIPHAADALAGALKQTHGRYAAYWNALHGSSGHVWQGRFYSCPLDSDHLWIATRYAELNPVRAGLVPQAEMWPWSSALAHTSSSKSDVHLELGTWRKRWIPDSWKEYLSAGETASEIKSIRQCTHTGRPLGGLDFVKSLEETTERQLTPRKGGRPRSLPAASSQTNLAFARNESKTVQRTNKRRDTRK